VRRLPFVILVLVAVALAAVVLAAPRSASLRSGPKTSSAGAPPVLAHVRGVTIVRRFPAAGGLEGYVLQVGAARSIAFGVDRGRYLVLGRLLDAAGHDLTKSYAARYLLAGGVWNALSKAAWIARGARHPRAIVYAFVDPNCPYCHVFWKEAHALYARGLEVRYLLVPVIRPSSLNKAAWVLAGKNRLGRLIAQERDYGKPDAPRLAHPDAAEIAILKRNTRMMLALGLNGTPGFVYRLHGQGPVRFLDGLPAPQDLAPLFLPPPSG